ncbi:MAG: FAD-dependent oxidoreductase [Burkholderiaceae bacterium]
MSGAPSTSTAMVVDEHAGRVDVAVVGAGPAGLAAATEAARAGLSVALFDEQPEPGGQIYRAIEAVSANDPRLLALLGEDYARGRDLVAAFRASGAQWHARHSVFDLSADGGLAVLGPDGARWWQARRVIVATGAMERPVAVPGWTLPGVMGVGAAQTLLKQSALVPDEPTVLAGSGPLLFLAASQLLAAGASVAAILETTPAGNLQRAAPHLIRAFMAGPEIRKGIAWRRALMRAGVPFHGRVDDLRIDGDEHRKTVTAHSRGRPIEIACSLVLLHEGVVPSTQLPMIAGVDHHYDDLQASWHARVDAAGRTNQAAILVAGDCAGIGGAELAAARGRLAGLAAAADLGAMDAAQAHRRGGDAHELLARKAPLRRFLDTLYRPRQQVLVPPDDDTIVCRCEEVRAGELRKMAALGCTGPNQAKAFSRCGMGPCQGRQCSLTAAQILAHESGRSVAAAGHFRVRPPVKPVTVGELAAMVGLGAPPETGPLLPTGPGESGPAKAGAAETLTAVAGTAESDTPDRDTPGTGPAKAGPSDRDARS